MRNLRNIAIIAHVDHGKTTLVDFLLKQSHTFRENSLEFQKELILDSNELERERGITILAKNTAIEYKGIKINIIDTPGHADFGGEVERTLHMADGCLLLVDAQEGPMPQTRFVLQKALQLNLKVIVVINKIDKRDRRISEVLEEINALFLELAHEDHHLDFEILYAVGREGKAFASLPNGSPDSVPPGTLEPLFEAIISFVPAPQNSSDGPFQMLVTALDYDDFKGKYAIGRIHRGEAKSSLAVVAIDKDGKKVSSRIEKVFVSHGLERVEVASAKAGDIVAITGIPEAHINTTICDSNSVEPLPLIAINEPTLRILIAPNTSPFMGQDGKFLTSRQIEERLDKELETNVSLRVSKEGSGKFLLSGRGELHLSVLIETMVREGFEIEVAKPEVITKTENKVEMEPVEEVVIDTSEDYRGIITAELAKRKADLKDILIHAGGVRFIYEMPTNSLLGLRNLLMRKTRGSFVLNSTFLRFAPIKDVPERSRNGVLIASQSGQAVAFGLEVAQGRGSTFVAPGTQVYEGMIIGENSRAEDLEINVCKGKELSNMRATGTDRSVNLEPPISMTLEEGLEYVEEDELLEVTSKHIRLRKKALSKSGRVAEKRNKQK
uniref:50S ribosomal subunit assembly factor BipA n=2 Tax=Parcubacteria group TaxID=1794811 RepID=A0A0H4T724_9BACT|nr:GTP-binding protein TypA, GTP-binding protein [uncultured Parcubacteria bacterium Rifle_16ft_4_minimus_37647]